MKQAVAITGVGAVTPLGPNAAESWRRLVAGKAIRGEVTLFPTDGCRCQHAAEVASLPPIPELPNRVAARLSRASRLAIPAAREALDQAGLLGDRAALADLPISASTTGGAMALGEAFLRNALEGIRGRGQLRRVARYQPQQQILDLQGALGIDGASMIVANACASGANAIGHGLDLIRAGEADRVLVGGFEALTELLFVGFDCLQAASTDCCRPFDMGRTGLMLGEAAAFMVLEPVDLAVRRGARPLALLTGYGHCTDLHHLTQPREDGAALVHAMTSALALAGLAPSDIGYVNAHGTATPLNDSAEAIAFERCFGPTLSATAISSTKAAIGHTLAAAGSVEAVFSVMALANAMLPPNLNLRDPIPELTSSLVSLETRARVLRHVMSVNLGFGGSNAALIFSRP